MAINFASLLSSGRWSRQQAESLVALSKEQARENTGWVMRGVSAILPRVGEKTIATGVSQLSFTLDSNPDVGSRFIITALDSDHLLVPNANAINGRYSDLTLGDNLLIPRGATAYLVTVSTNVLEVI